MRALLIKPDSVEEIEIDDSIATMQAVIGCDTLTLAGRPAPRHVAWVDDTGMLTAKEGTQVTIPFWYPDYLYGRILITGIDDEGETVGATLDADMVRGAIYSGVLKDMDGDGSLTAVVRPGEPLCAHDDEEMH